jgi:hypothetical protein
LRTSRVAVLAGTVVAALIVAGCGGGGGELSTSSISKAAFIKKLDAICAKGNETAEANFDTYAKRTNFTPAEINKKMSEAEAAELAETVLLPAIKQEVAQIRQLSVPSGDQDRIEAMVDAIEEGIETTERIPKVVLEEIPVGFGVANRLAKEYGLQVCGNR